MKIDPSLPLRPPKLLPGDTIGVVASSSPFDRTSFEKGIASIHGMGFKTKIDSRAFIADDYLAGSDESRADQLNSMFGDDDVQAVMCARGGYGALRILERLDYDLLSAHPKPLVGFSDITALHQALFAKCGLVSFHGPTVTTLWKEDADTRRAWRTALTSTEAQTVTLRAEDFLLPGKALGVLVGGNLTVLSHLIGTSYWVSLEAKILLIEDIGEAPYRIDRMLTQMRLAGLLEGLGGVVVGSFHRCGDLEQIHRMVTALFAPMAIPVAAGLPIGHGDTNLTIPLGAVARLDSDAGVLDFPEPVLEEA